MFILKKIKSSIYNILISIPRFFQFTKDYYLFKKLNKKDNRFILKWKEKMPILTDKVKNTPYSRDYVYHTAWAARILAQEKPKKHIDISSMVYFNTIISAFIPIENYDFRPLIINIDNLQTKSGNLLSLPFNDSSVESLSCMHTVEHIGLGRYGDNIDPQGDLKSINELKRVLARNGNLLFVVPIGKSKIVFNAHRIYSYQQIIDYFRELKLIEFSMIAKAEIFEGIIKNPDISLIDKQKYACGCFWFKK